MKKLLIIPILLFFTGCATSVYNLSESEQENITYRVFDYPYSEVFTASLQQLQSGQAVIETVDRESGIINTDWLQNDSLMRQFLVGGQRARLSLSISELGENRTRVFVRLSTQAQGSFGSWSENPVTKASAEQNIAPFFEQVAERLTR